MEWCYVWWPWLTSKRVAQVCQHQLSFLLPVRRDSIAQSLLRQRVWLAGWLSVTRRYCIKTAKPIWKRFRPPESPIILVSWDPCADTQFHGDPFSGGVKYTGVGKLAIFVWFSTDIAVYLGNGARCEIGRRLLWNVNRKSLVPDWMV